MTEAGRHHLVDAPLVSPAPKAGLIDVFRRRYLLRMLVQREISARYQGSFLGLLWSYINPLSQLFIYWFVMGKIMNRGTENFAVHVFCGLIIVQFFVETFNAGTRSIVRNKGLVQKMAVPREMFPVASMLVSFYHMGPQLVILTVVSVLSGWTPNLEYLAGVVLAMLIIALLGTSLALMFSVANVFLRDVSSFVSILTNFVRFGVPMIYPYILVDARFGWFAQFYLLNPIADAVLLMQQAFWVGTTEHPELTHATHIPGNLWAFSFLALGVSALMLLLGQFIFKRFENRIPERL
ncbi:ABC transporter permease [Nocardioides caricicola]|uniref:Transport permease protein n=1 Tax=Nocardioides caricicola TaxID=634770 RepID=A0ABW0N4J8_9ACTN